MDIELKTPFVRLKYNDCMRFYGTDKPDIRFQMLIHDLTDIFKGCRFEIMEDVIKNGGVVRAIKVDGAASFSRKQIDELTLFAKRNGAKGLLSLKMEEGLKGRLTDYLSEDKRDEIIKRLNVSKGDLVLLIADQEEKSSSVLGILRNHLAQKLLLIEKREFSGCWVTEFPLFETDQDGKIVARHHPFTSPVEEDIKFLQSKPLSVRARAYDLVINGIELGGGSIRIYKKELQQEILKILGISREEARQNFGFFLDAFDYGVPPHGGIALGLDRLVMLILGLDSIREIIAFPKTQSSQCLLTGAPSSLKAEQLKELRIRIETQDK
jgi:aspartyl-tRNA synthetase